MDSRIIDLLPWYVNGTLSSSETSELEASLDDHPAYRAHLAFYENLRAAVKNDAPEVSPDVGLNRALKLIATDGTAHAETRLAQDKSREKRGWWQRLLGDGFRPQYAYTLGALVIALQTGVIGYFVADRESAFSETRARATVPAAIGPFIKASFKPDAKEAEVRFLLVGLGASIVGGPSQLGDYYLFLDAKRTDWAAQQLRQSPIIDAITVIATLPAAKE